MDGQAIGEPTMWMMLALLLTPFSEAGSLDYLEVAGPFGSPGAQDATAAHWNPAGLAMRGGTRFHIEGAPTFAGVSFDRDDPNGHGGLDKYRLSAVVPFAGFATDAGVDGLGLGLSLAVPFARGAGKGPDGAASGRYSMTSGQIQAIYVTAASAWNFMDRVSVGAGVTLVHSSWDAELSTEALTSLNDQLAAMGQDPGYDDTMIEDPDYGATIKYGHMSDNKVTFNVGVQVKVIDQVKISAAYTHGTRVKNTGDMVIVLGCPPQDDVLGRFGSEAFGLCDTEVDANGSVGYPLPARFNASVVVEPMERLRLEAMGGWVNWGKFQDFEIEVKDVGQLNDLSEDAAALLNQERSWARDNRDSYWLGVDGKMKLNKVFGVGARLLYDRAAVPDTTLSPSNYDANTVILGGLVMVRPAPHFRVGVGFSQYFVQQRTTDSSAFGMTLNVDERKEDRYAYPAMNGTYSSSISRISLAVRGHFGKGWEDEHD